MFMYYTMYELYLCMNEYEMCGDMHLAACTMYINCSCVCLDCNLEVSVDTCFNMFNIMFKFIESILIKIDGCLQNDLKK